MAVDSIKRALPSAVYMTCWQGCKAAGEQSRGWSGGSAEDRGLEDGCAGQDDCAVKLGGRLRGTAVQTEGPRGRDLLAACRLALSEQDFSD